VKAELTLDTQELVRHFMLEEGHHPTAGQGQGRGGYTHHRQDLGHIPIQDAAWFVRFPSAATRIGERMPVQTGQSYSRLV
jgi:hypothetical protein